MKHLNVKKKLKLDAIILGLIIAGLLVKIILAPRIPDFMMLVICAAGLIAVIVELKSDVYLSKEEYLEKKAEYLIEKSKDGSAKFKYKKKENIGLLVLVGLVIITPFNMLYSNYFFCDWAYKNDIKDLKYMYSESLERYGHFPNDIPEGAKNVDWEHFPSFHSSTTYLKFEASDKYIEELVKTFKDKNRLYSYKTMKDEMTENDMVLGWFNSKGERFQIFDSNNALKKDEVQVVFPKNEGEGMIYFSGEGEGAYDTKFDNGILVNLKTNTVVYFAGHNS